MSGITKRPMFFSGSGADGARTCCPGGKWAAPGPGTRRQSYFPRQLLKRRETGQLPARGSITLRLETHAFETGRARGRAVRYARGGGGSERGARRGEGDDEGEREGEKRPRACVCRPPRRGGKKERRTTRPFCFRLSPSQSFSCLAPHRTRIFPLASRAHAR